MNLKQTSTPVRLEYKTVYIRSSRPSDISDVGDNLRSMDKLECLLHSGVSPREAIRNGMETDYHTWTICSNNTKKPLACFGIGPVQPEHTNYIWLLCTEDLITETGREFVVASREWVKHLVNRFKLPCVNEVYSKNTTAIRWLKWCDAVIEEPNEKDFSLFIIYPNK